ncbi:MAG TPA: OB-fold nucleic acid binding domain-containing protein, partial [Geobacterales bacterium]|nr:OB-fold nucleic acid binding domain-containing protein [Geobacterales bacterium]
MEKTAQRGGAKSAISGKKEPEAAESKAAKIPGTENGAAGQGAEVEGALADARHAYRTSTCGALRRADAGKHVRLSGWVHRVRDHGGLLFIDLRDHYGLTQCVVDPSAPAFKAAEQVRAEWVIRVDGDVV